MTHLIFAIARPFCAEQKINKVRDWQWLDDLDPRCECCSSVRGPRFDASVMTHLTQHETLTSGVDEDILFPRHRPKFQWQCGAALLPSSDGTSASGYPTTTMHSSSGITNLTLHHLRHHSLSTSSPSFLHIYVQEELRPSHSAYRRSPPDRAVSPMTVSLDGPSCSAPLTSHNFSIPSH